MSSGAQNPLEPLVRMIVQQVVRELQSEGGEGTAATAKRLLSPEEAAAYLALSKREVYNMIANGKLPAVQHGRRKMIDIRDLETWIEEHKR
jgi:excisionase family DNA binding protein